MHGSQGGFTRKNDNPSIVVKYGDIYNGHIEAGDLLLDNGALMLFDLLESAESTQGLVNVFKYLAYLYSGVDYGIINADELVDIFNVYNPVVSTGGALYDYMRIWENTTLYKYYKKETISCPKYAEGEYYKVYMEGEIANLAYGIVISRNYNDNYFKEKGVTVEQLRAYKTEGEKFTNLKAEEIEQIYEAMVENHRKSVLSIVGDMGLKEYQIDALTAIHYQYGNIGNFKSAYNEYYAKRKRRRISEKF